MISDICKKNNFSIISGASLPLAPPVIARSASDKAISFMSPFVLKTIKQVKRLIVAVIGFTVLLIGLAMIVTPGPALVVIPVGLAILATEFVWARSLLKRVKNRFKEERISETK